MSKACKETRVQLCKEIDFGDGEVSTIRAMVTEEQALVVFKLEEAAYYLKKVAEYLEGQKEKVICNKGKKAFGMLADDNYTIIQSHDGSRIMHDKDNPRTEVYIELIEDAFSEKE